MNNQSGLDDFYPLSECPAEEEMNNSQKLFVQEKLNLIASHFFIQQHCRCLDHAKESTNAKFNTPIDRQHRYGRYSHYSLSHTLQTLGSNNRQRRGNVWWIARNGYLQTGGLQSKCFHRLLCPDLDGNFHGKVYGGHVSFQESHFEP